MVLTSEKNRDARSGQDTCCHLPDAELDIVIPVYNEKDNILKVLGALAREMKTSARVLICTTCRTTTPCPRCAAIPMSMPGWRWNS